MKVELWIDEKGITITNEDDGLLVEFYKNEWDAENKETKHTRFELLFRTDKEIREFMEAMNLVRSHSNE